MFFLQLDVFDSVHSLAMSEAWSQFCVAASTSSFLVFWMLPGRCKLPPQMSGDMEKLEKMLGSRVAGANLKDLLAGEETLSWNCLKLLEITQNWSYFKSFSGCTSMLRKTNPISLPMSEMWFAKQIALKEVRCLCRPRAFGLALLDLCPQLPRCCTAT